MIKHIVRTAGLLCLLLASFPPAASSQTTQVSVGDTVPFWTYRSTYFSRGYTRSEAICRAVGEHCYVFADITRWNFGDVDSADVAAIVEAFDHHTAVIDSSASGVLSSDAGIFDKVTSAFGEPPDFDLDPKIYILLVDVQVQGQTGWQRTEGSFFGPMSQYGYFDPRHEFSTRVDTLSNGHEMLYLDCLPTNPSSRTALSSLAHNLQRMIHWYQDPNEERWLSEGCSMLAQFLCGYGVTTGYFPPMEPFVSMSYHDDDWGDAIWEPDVVQNSMLMHFYFEKFGQPFVTALVADAEHQGVEGIDSTLAALDFGATFSSAFEDFALTWYFLSLGLAADSSFFNGRYTLKYITPQQMKNTIINTFLYWGMPGFLEPPYPYNWTSSWSAAFLCMTAPFSGDIDSVLVFNGEDGSEYSLVVIKTKSDWLQPLDPNSEVELIPLDAENRGYSDVTGYKIDYKTIYMAIITRQLAGQGTLFISDDITPPDSLHVIAFHGPIDDRSLDIYVFSPEQIISGPNQMPLVRLIQNSKSDTLEMRRFRPVAQQGPFGQPSAVHSSLPHIYQGNYLLESDGTIAVQVSGQDVSGNHAPDLSSSFTVDFVRAGTGSRICSADSLLFLDIPPQALLKDTWVTVIPRDEETETAVLRGIAPSSEQPSSWEDHAGGKIYAIGPEEMSFAYPALLTLYYDRVDTPTDAADLAICRKSLQGWECIGGTALQSQRACCVLIERGGVYQIRSGRPGTDSDLLPSSYDLGQNYPNPFNASTRIRFAVGSGQSSVHVALKIFNVMGQEVRKLVDDEQGPGWYTVQWDGTDAGGQAVASGVYFYTLSVNNGQWQKTNKLIMMK